MRALVAAPLLALRFARALLLSGLDTLGVILRSGVIRRTPPPAALLRVGFAPLSPLGAAILGAMVTLTPGTTTIDIDLEKRELLLHVLDARDSESLLREIRQSFEPGLRALFGRQEGA